MATPPAAPPDCDRDTVLDGMLLFNLLPKPRAALAKQLELVEVEPGGVLLRRGEPSPGVFFVHSGAFVFVDSHGRVQNDTQITCGRFFGEQSVLLGNANPVEVRAAQGADSSRASVKRAIKRGADSSRASVKRAIKPLSQANPPTEINCLRVG
ncbi:hypothetical protein DIPPA_06999 [Diplonema papillatum]|nr:hypothetical protein DIPPA_06999 [Diplonema papillatum]